jgi:hypothetical protein
MMILSAGKISHWKDWLMKASWQHSGTKGSGSPWIRYVTGKRWRICGKTVMLHGRYGSGYKITC